MSFCKWLLVLVTPAFALPATISQAQSPTELYIVLTQPLTDTGLAVTKGDTISVSATGIQNWFTGNCNNDCLSTPNGSDCPYTGFYAQGLPCWSLIGQIGDGKPFFVGASLQDFVVPESGELYLGNNDTYYPDDTGAWFATINQNGKLQGGCPCDRSTQGEFPSSAGDPENIGSGTDGGSVASGYFRSGGSGAKSGELGRLSLSRRQTNSQAGGVGPRALTGDFSVDLATGNLFYEDTDYTTAGQNPLSFTRFYNSRANISGAPTLAVSVGANWRTTYDRYLQLSATKVIAERQDGQQLIFTLLSGVWKSDSDIDLTLTSSGSTWTLTDHGDTKEIYAADGTTKALLESIESRNGYTQALAYNTSHQLTSVKDSYNRSLLLTYNSTGTLEEVTTPDDTIIAYGYTAVPLTGGYNLTSVSYPTEPISTIQYSYLNSFQPQQLWGVTDENGDSYITWTYFGYSKIAGSYLGGGLDSVAYDYNADGSTTVTSPLGISDTYTFTLLQGIPKVTKISRAATATTAAATETFAYDSNGYLASGIDWNGNKTTYVSNSNGDPTTINEAVGTTAARTTTIKYDSTWIHQPDTVTTTGLTTSYTYDANGNVLTGTLKDATTTTVPYSTSGQTRIWTNTWSDYLLSSLKTPNGNTTKFAYDSAGALTSITDALGHITHITENTAGGLPKTIVDPNNVTTTLTYDARQRQTGSTISASGGSFATQYAINPIGAIAKLTLPDNSYLAFTYRPSHLLSETADALGNSAVNTWDGLDDVTQVNLANSSGTVENTHSATFDAIGRKLTDVGGAGQTTTFTYDKDGNALTVKDGDGHTTNNVYDPLNRLIKSTDANGGVTTITYDAHNRPVTVTDANGHTTKYVYDGFGDLISQTSPDSGVTVFRYDADGNLIQKLDALGIITNHTYDKLDRNLTTTYPADASENVHYTYDQTGTGFSFGIGRLTSVTDAAGSLTRAYDERGNLLSEKRINGKTALTTAYTYDPASRIASTTYPDGTLVTNKYNAAGYLTQVSAKPSGSTTTTTLATIGHLPFGPINSVTYGNGIAETWTYDLDYRPTGIADTLSAKSLQNLAYVYDNANNLKTISDAVNAANSQTLGYDVINRLTSAASGAGGYGTFAWTYDKVGNRLTQKLGTTTTAYGYTPGTNRLASIGSVKVATNANGNITSIPPANDSALATFAYNKANRLASVTGSPQAATFVYDWAGQRFSKAHPSSTPILYSYAQDGTLIAENNSGMLTDYVYADGRPIADLQPATSITADRVNYILADHLGTPQVAVNSSGIKVWASTYQPFGEAVTPGGSVVQNLRFPGQNADSETGFSYNLNRDYMPNFGRYLQADPISLIGNMNRFVYAHDSPLDRVDPTGLLDIFGFGGWSKDNVEGIGIVGSNTDQGGPYFGTIVGIGGTVPMGPVEGDGYVGVETTTTIFGDEVNPIVLGGFGSNSDTSEGGGFGGYLDPSGEYGLYFYENVKIFGNDFSVGFGVSLNDLANALNNSYNWIHCRH